jgi:VanZ family protein
VLLVIIGELLPGSSPPITLLSDYHVSDKLMHFGAYAVLAFIPTLGLRFRGALPYILATEVVGVGLEFVQLLVPDRSCNIYDAAANTAGVLAGVAVAILIRSRGYRAEPCAVNE